MHRLHECVTNEIETILKHGISTSNLQILGELVDIRKDIEEMWHWKAEDAIVAISENKAARGVSVDELLNDVRHLNEKMKTSDSTELTNKFKDDIKLLMLYAEKIKGIIEDVQVDSEIMSKFKNLFRY